MKRTALCVVVAMILVVAATPAAAQTKVAVIDVQRVVSESDPGKEALQKLAGLRDAKAGEGQTLQQDLQALREQFSKQQFTLSEEKLEELQKQIQDKGIALQRFEDDARRELEEARTKELGRLEQQIMPIINVIGQEQGLTLIFNKFQSGLVYADDTIDITDEVIRRFNTQQ